MVLLRGGQYWWLGALVLVALVCGAVAPCGAFLAIPYDDYGRPSEAFFAENGLSHEEVLGGIGYGGLLNPECKKSLTDGAAHGFLPQASGLGVYEFGNRDLCSSREGYTYEVVRGSCRKNDSSRSVPFFAGVCVPDACDLGSGTVPITGKIVCTVTHEEVAPLTMSAGGYVTCVVLFVLVSCVLIGTAVDQHTGDSRSGFMGRLSHSIIGKGCLVFSLPRSYKSLFTVHQNEVLGIHGVRTLALLTIVFGHTSLFLTQYSSNKLFIDEFLRYSSIGWLSTTGFLSVGTFFMLSGFFGSLSIWNFYDSLSKGGTSRLRLSKVYFKVVLIRLLRIWPTMGVVFLVYINITTKLSNNFVYHMYHDFVYERCGGGRWWSSMLLINNWYPDPFGDGFKSVCMGWSWYLSVDFQLHLVVPLVIFWLFSWYHSAKLKNGLVILISALLFFSIAVLAVIFKEDIAFNPLEGYNLEFFNYIYNKPWGNVAVFGTGIFVFALLKGSEFQLQLRRVTWYVVYFVALVLMAVTSRAPFFSEGPWGTTQTAIFGAFGAWGWVLGVGVVVAVCCLSHNAGLPMPVRALSESSALLHPLTSQSPPGGSLLNSMLGWGPFIFFSRLSFGIYLIHPMVLFYLLSTTDRPYHMRSSDAFVYFMAAVMLSTLCASVEYALVQRPMTVLIGKFTKKGAKRPTHAATGTAPATDTASATGTPTEALSP